MAYEIIYKNGDKEIVHADDYRISNGTATFREKHYHTGADMMNDYGQWRTVATIPNISRIQKYTPPPTPPEVVLRRWLYAICIIGAAFGIYWFMLR